MDSELESHDEFLAKKAAAIRRLTKNVLRDVVEIGGHLAEAKEKCPHGKWASWLREEFVWGDDTAIRLMRAAEFFKTRNLRDFEDVGLSMVYLLSAPSTPQAARDKIISSFQAGETPTYSDARRTVQAYRTGIATRAATITDFPDHVTPAAIIPFPSPSPEPRSPPVDSHIVHNRTVDWNLLGRLRNAASCIDYVARTPHLDEEVRALIEDGHWRDILRAAESFAIAGEIGKRLMAAVPKAEP